MWINSPITAPPRDILFPFSLLLVVLAIGAQAAGTPKQALAAHNAARAKHDAPPLKWSEKLASYARQHASSCRFEHTQGPYGENLAWGTGLTYQGAVDMWMAEAKDYQPGSSSALHFTQVVWKGSKEVGCALITTCSGSQLGNGRRNASAAAHHHHRQDKTHRKHGKHGKHGGKGKHVGHAQHGSKKEAQHQHQHHRRPSHATHKPKPKKLKPKSKASQHGKAAEATEYTPTKPHLPQHNHKHQKATHAHDEPQHHHDAAPSKASASKEGKHERRLWPGWLAPFPSSGTGWQTGPLPYEPESTGSTGGSGNGGGGGGGGGGQQGGGGSGGGTGGGGDNGGGNGGGGGGGGGSGFVMCEYSPAGNVMGEFDQNVS